MRRRLAIIATLAAGVLAVAPVAYGHEYNPPNGGIGDTPLNSEQARANAIDNFFAAFDHSQNVNALVRNPTCEEHGTEEGIHPPGNP